MPEYFALITRALIVLEGIALTGAPRPAVARAAPAPTPPHPAPLQRLCAEQAAHLPPPLIVPAGLPAAGDEDFDIFRASYPYAAKHALTLFGVGQLSSLLGEAASAQGAGALLALVK